LSYPARNAKANTITK